MNQVKKLEEIGLDKLPICVAKTQFSFTDDQKIMGAPTDFDIEIQDVRVSAKEQASSLFKLQTSW